MYCKCTFIIFILHQFFTKTELIINFIRHIWTRNYLYCSEGNASLIFVTTNAGKIFLCLFPRTCYIHLTNRLYARYLYALNIKIKIKKNSCQHILNGCWKINEIKLICLQCHNVLCFKKLYYTHEELDYHPRVQHFADIHTKTTKNV